MEEKFRCPKCGEELTIHYLRAGEKTSCPHCKAVITVPEVTVDTAESSEKNAFQAIKELILKKKGVSDSRYWVLVIFKDVVKITGIIYFLYSCFWVGLSYLHFDIPVWLYSFLNYLGSILSGFIILLLLLILAEGIQIFIAIEENTRNSFLLFDRYLRNDKKLE